MKAAYLPSLPEGLCPVEMARCSRACPCLKLLKTRGIFLFTQLLVLLCRVHGQMETCFFFFPFPFLGPHTWHMEVPRLGDELELQLPAYAIVTEMQIRAASVAYTAAGANTDP